MKFNGKKLLTAEVLAKKEVAYQKNLKRIQSVHRRFHSLLQRVVDGLEKAGNAVTTFAIDKTYKAEYAHVAFIRKAIDTRIAAGKVLKKWQKDNEAEIKALKSALERA